jgi:2-polyprenyl-6-methoxyphenol hydroxylase-like FAD-dependent oxidoreductase
MDIAIAGCGPAGLAAALMLRRDGHRVTIYERFAAAQPIGSGFMVQPVGLAVLETLGLKAAAIEAGARLTRLLGRVEPSGRVVLDVRYAALPGVAFGLGMHRATLFDLLHSSAAEAGVSFETGRTVVGSTEAPARRLVFSDGLQSARFDLVVDALGASSPLARKAGGDLAYGALWASLDWARDAGLDPNRLEQRYVRASTMVGVLPIGRAPGADTPKVAFFWSLRGDRFPQWRERGLSAWRDEVARLWPATEPLLAQISDPAQLTFARYAHASASAPAAPGLVHIGDAWRSTSPQLGQGANMALLDAYALAKALREGADLDAALGRYVRFRRGHVALYQAMSWAFTPAYQSDSLWLPRLRDGFVGPLSRIWPATLVQAAIVSGLVGNPLGALGLSIASAREAPVAEIAA